MQWAAEQPTAAEGTSQAPSIVWYGAILGALDHLDLFAAGSHSPCRGAGLQLGQTIKVEGYT